MRTFETGETSRTMPALRQLGDELLVLDGAEPVPDAIRLQRLERAADRGRPRHLARVRHRAEALRLRQLEHRRVGLGRILGLEPAETDADHAAVCVLGRIAHDRLGLVERKAADDVRGQPDLDAVQLAGLLGPVAVAGEDVVPGDAAAHALGRGEDRLDVDRAVGGGLGGVVDDDLAEIVSRPQRVRRQDPDLDEVLEVAELVELREPLDGVRRQRVVVAARDLEQRLRPDGALQVDVELDLRVRHSVTSGGPCQRFSKNNASQIEPS